MSDTSDSTVLSDRVRRSLRGHRRLRYGLLGLWLGAVPCLFALGLLGPPNWLMTGLMIFIFGTWVVLGAAHQLYRCPACACFFHVKGWYGNAFSSKCLNCGQGLGAIDDAA